MKRSQHGRITSEDILFILYPLKFVMNFMKKPEFLNTLRASS